MKNNPTSTQPAQEAASTTEPATKAHTETPHYVAFGNPADKPTDKNPTPTTLKPVPNPEASLGEEASTEEEVRAAYSRDDPRYAGGQPFDLKQEQTDW